MGYMLERQWEAHTRIQDGFSRIVFEDGEEITVKNDGKTGIDFVEEYLDEMKKKLSLTPGGSRPASADATWTFL